MVAACPFPASRGTPVRIQQMGEALDSLGYDVHVVTYHLAQERPVKNLQIHRTRNVPYYTELGAGPNYFKLLVLDPMLVRRLTQVVRRHRIRIIHAHHFEGALCALAVKRMIGGVQVIYDAHTSLKEELFDYQFRLPRFIKKAASDILDSGIPRWCDHVVTVSDKLKDEVMEHGVPESKITVIPLAVNRMDFPPVDKATVRAALNMTDRPTVVYTGNLAPFQGVDHLLRSMSKVKDRLPNAHLVLVSAPTEPYKAMVKSLELDQHVSFVGDLTFDKVRDYLAAADVVVLPRDRCTGFPLKLLNYMAAGRAIVAFKGSSAEVLVHMNNGYVVPGSDEDDFTQGIIRLLTDKNLNTTLGQAARTAVDPYETSAVTARIGHLYEHIEANGRAHHAE
jgi:glycosyltransferase involved in cell wall biosynthesis